MADAPRWWEARRAQNRKPATYTCPLCRRQLPSLSEHMLLFPEGDHSRRRHAHTACVLEARKQGKLRTKAEWEAAHAPVTRAQPGRERSRRRLSASRILSALSPRLKRSRPSDS
jgi:hypothetical protein